MATSPIVAGNGNGNGAAPSPRPWALADTLRMIRELSRALEDQCARAQDEYAEEKGGRASRASFEALALRAQEIRVRSEAVAREVGALPDAHQPAATRPSNGTAETRMCAVSFALALKLDGVSRERTEALLVDEFGRDDAAEIADEAFGPSRQAA